MCWLSHEKRREGKKTASKEGRGAWGREKEERRKLCGVRLHSKKRRLANERKRGLALEKK